MNKPWIERFWSKVKMAGPDECWLWIDKPSEYGYGRLSISQKNFLAHRLSFLIANGKIDQELLVIHSCDTKLCVNPRHLSQGTITRNIQEATERGLMPRGSRHGNSKLSDSDVAAIKAMAARPGIGYPAVASTYGINKSHVCRIVHSKARSLPSN